MFRERIVHEIICNDCGVSTPLNQDSSTGLFAYELLQKADWKIGDEDYCPKCAKNHEEIKSCPCCGETVHISKIDNGEYYIHCTNCGLRTGFYKIKEEVLKTWNKRYYETLF